MAQIDPRSAPTGADGASPGLARLVRSTTIGVGSQPQPQPIPATRRAKAGLRRVVERAEAEGDDEWDSLAKRGRSTSRALALAQEALVVRSAAQPRRSASMAKTKITRIGSHDIVLRAFRVNPADDVRYGETISSVVRRTTVGTAPLGNALDVRRAKTRNVRPALEVYDRGADNFGRPKTFQILRNLIRRSVGLPR